MGALKNAKHEAVALAFMKDPKRVGYKAYLSVYPDSSVAAAQTAFGRLLKKAEFSARIAELKTAVADATVMDLQEVLAELSKLGRANMEDFININNEGEARLDFSALTREQAAAIGELTVETSTIIGKEDDDDSVAITRTKFKLHDKRGALAELRRHHEPMKHEHTGKNGKPIAVRDATQLTDIEVARRIAFLLTTAAKPKAA